MSILNLRRTIARVLAPAITVLSLGRIEVDPSGEAGGTDTSQQKRGQAMREVEAPPKPPCQPEALEQSSAPATLLHGTNVGARRPYDPSQVRVRGPEAVHAAEVSCTSRADTAHGHLP